ncbi:MULTISPECIES: N-acetylmuramic acid 6-phosphate etherase [Anaerococcus]|uniref:N-acetylmuramic acid 6-phosphate etherase n=1 Tax=Anaerococcus octavius TaxID=54007 RepID=A0A380WVH7_9FIRM|nr:MULTISPECIES: N-acetylmuramic acid 6-phosphate etherase [Anaerococcus]MDU5229137.1 N-acetylmuramic acid 6-phosphate etherase [Anaerococcus sp.]MDU7411149.1 N-acetylmuramic acid 6-phosphate etherase [Anaerococcus sp.]SUU93028.1 N-acetylmuramic acid 6-phosphate etherase [Anaerococcus octavius]
MRLSSTEDRNPNSYDLDLKSTREILDIINGEDQKIAIKVNEAMDQIEVLVDEVIKTFNNAGRLFYLGAGTSGRLGVLDASETVPTFSVDPKMVTGLIAGGDNALRNPIENAEDSKDAAKIDLQKENLTENDFVIGIAASGRTPYAIGAIEYAKEIGAKTGSIACNKEAKISSYADFPIEIETGAEVLSGSTRMKAGTATKLVLNMITTTAMIKIGKVYDNLMVDVKPTNEKLVDRATKIISEISGCDYEKSNELLKDANNNVKLAIIMATKDVDYEKASEILEKNKGFIREDL